MNQSIDEQIETVKEKQKDHSSDYRNSEVSKEVAELVAKRFANDYNFGMGNLIGNRQAKRKSSNKEVDHILTLRNENGVEALYLINYTNKGFVVVPADKRVGPILAFSESNKMPITKEEPIPPGLDSWLKSYISIISHFKNSRKKGSSRSSLWDRLIGKKSLQKEPIDPGCEEWTERVDPLLETDWGQTGGWNDSMPTNGFCLSDPSYPNDGHSYVGCGPIAMGQIMKYHEYPNSYNWNSMDNTQGTSESADFLRDVADAANVDYSCDATSTSPTSYIPTLFNFGYTSNMDRVDLASNGASIRADLNQSNPVLMRGNGHAWIGDGYIYSGLCPSGNYRLKYHLVWGWNDPSSNGWFEVSDFTVYGKNYFPNSEVIIDIKP